MPIWTAIADDHQISVTEAELNEFRNSFPLTLPQERISQLLWVDLYVLFELRWVDPFDVLEAIRNLESGEPHNGIKRATAFRGAPLRGLWHKHYFSPRFMARNMVLSMGKGGLERIVNQVMDPRKSDVVTSDMVNELAHRATVKAIEDRAGREQLTGEWVVFAKAGGQNYYLCLGAHETGDQQLYDRIAAHCIRDFPELPFWQSRGQQTPKGGK